MRWGLVVFVLLCSLVVNGQDTTNYCTQIKTGQFYTVSGSDTCYIRRTADRQFERCRADTTETTFIVVWLRTNKYILRDINYNPSTAQRVMHRDAVITILEINEDHYRVHFKRKGQKKQYFNIYCAQ